MSLRIATYNLLAGGSARRAHHWNMVRDHIAPDILLTQECKAPDSRQFPHKTNIWTEAVKRRPGEHGYVRMVHRMIDRLKPHARVADLVLGGDFNVAVGFREAEDPLPMSPAERMVLTRLVEELDVFPCWQTYHPGQPLAQTLRWTGNRAVPYHCDGIFAPRGWRARLQSCEVVSGPEWDRLSDHNPIVAEFTT